MKDVYKERAGNTIDTISMRTKIVKEMITGERPADPKQADKYLQDVLRGLESLQELMRLG